MSMTELMPAERHCAENDQAGSSGAAKRLRQLDVLRGVAILLVLGHHAPLDPEQAGRLRWLAFF